ncbi:MAG: folate-binding protein [Methylobacter sp.]|uniref:CAF17-like 4Fe-4S cluster assembly/insertion protein YgfZ n=1 Tax=Methylobacter sp. TaxID=2051955 RepID=UPI0027312478|nr:folate-binding protein [Methylobacter sp.]MDP1663894.1 folate-binding protein [Methylobacter sp.]
MNPNWKNFLLSKNAVFDNDINVVFLSPEHEGNKRIYPITQLGVLTVAGIDAAKFLQGQMTCNINDITDIKSSLGALCNLKGRAITTFLLVKSADAFLMILPKELLASVKKRLQMYVLRSNVSLTDSSDELCLIGLCDEASQSGEVSEHSFATSRQENIVVDFQNRSLIIAEADNAQALWEEQVKLGFQADDSAQWRYLDIISGIPWLTAETSEEFIPQMLNLDKLGGISFTKGCYTGQEIVARTHYLGKAKREMFLAECDVLTPPEPNSTIIDDSTGTEQSAGKVLYAQKGRDACKMLVILQNGVDTNADNLKLKNHNQDKITLLTL